MTLNLLDPAYDPFDPDAAPEPPAAETPAPALLVGRQWPAAARQVVQDPAGLRSVSEALARVDRIGLDCETTGLDPRADRLRLLTLSVPGRTFLVDCFAVHPAPLWGLLQEKELVGHFLQFDLSFPERLGFEAGRVSDTILASRVLHAGRRGVRHSLSACCERELGFPLDKSLQKSDWSGALSQEQLDYAARDAEVLLFLDDAQRQRIEADGLAWALAIENRCLPAVVWMANAGAPFDAAAWQRLLETAEQEAAELRRQLNAAAPVPSGAMFLDELGWNWDSPAEALKALQLVVQDNPEHAAALAEANSTADYVLSLVEQVYPIAGLLRQYRRVKARIDRYGANWLKFVAGGRLYPTWSQLGRTYDEEADDARQGADAGRMSCTKPPLQGVPRPTLHRPNDGAYRRCFTPGDGQVLVKADYATVELRIGARVAWEPRLIDLFRTGEDLHSATARLMFGGGPYAKESLERQVAKSANFGLLYGMSAAGFGAYCLAEGGIVLTSEKAAEMRDRWFGAYPGIRRWHNATRDDGTLETRTRAGRRRLLRAFEPDTLRLNSPVQGTGADGLKTALGLLWERRRECPGAVPVIACHDEICVQCPEEDAPAAAAWLQRAMRDAMEPLIDPIPVEVEAKVGRTWGG